MPTIDSVTTVEEKNQEFKESKLDDIHFNEFLEHEEKCITLEKIKEHRVEKIIKSATNVKQCV